ncbi:hypothetical protein Tco_0642471 [Tanacetum coccineum]
MSTPKFVATHNLVVFLEKPVESEGFKQIIDFLNVNPIKHALTVNPTIYTSCIKQLWVTAKVKKVNGQDQIQALVDKRKIVINEESIRCDLKLEDVEGSTCVPNATIFEELARMGAKTTAWNEFSGTMASAIICLANNQKFNFSKYILDNLKKLKPRRKYRKETKDHVSPSSSDPLPSAEDSSQLNELMVFCINLQEQLLDLQDAKAAQAQEIASLKKKVKKLKRRKISKSIGLRRLKKIVIDADDEVTLEPQNEDDADLMFDTLVLDGDEVVAEHAKEPEVVTTVSGPTTTTDELTLAQTLIKIAKSKKVEAITTAATSVIIAAVSRPKTKGIVFHEHEQTHRLIVSSTLPSSKDKGKAIIIKPERPLKRKEQVAADEEYAKQLAAEMEA